MKRAWAICAALFIASVVFVQTLDAQTSGAIICDGDGKSGARVQLLYVRTLTMPSVYTDTLASFRDWATQADKIYADSSNNQRRIRFQTTNCQIDVEEVVIQDDIRLNNHMTVSGRLWSMGYTSPERVYLAFVNSDDICGQSSYELDDRPTDDNLNNTQAQHALVWRKCWSGRFAAHELAHSFGAVQPSAPHYIAGAHTSDGYDLMGVGSSPCADQTGLNLLDCGKDDYFAVNPPAGSYLATHWNVANSKYLIRTAATSVRIINFFARWR